jgi:hypothetical protein
MTDLTNSELFKDLVSFKMEGYDIDLHNDFRCVQLIYLNTQKKLTLIFENVKIIKIGKKICIIFDDVIIEKIDAQFNGAAPESSIELFYRGRFQVGDKLIDTNENNQNYFYLEFVKGLSMELFARYVKVLEI